MDWLVLNEINQLEDLVKLSYSQPVIIYKHSTRCHASALAKERLESGWPEVKPAYIYYLDLLSYRSISNKIAEKFEVEHQSPQLLLLKDGQCVYQASHSDIKVTKLSGHLGQLKNQ